MRSWALWSIPARLVACLLAVETTAVILIGLGLVGSRAFLDHDLRMLVLICVAGIVYAEIAHDIEQTRRRLFDTQFHTELHVNLGSIWFFAGAVLLSPAWAGVCAVVVYTHLWWRSTGLRAPLYRQVFSAAVFVLASFAASAAMAYAGELGGWGGTRGVPVLVVGILVFATVNSAFVAGAIAVNNPQAELDQVMGDRDENLLEFTTLCLGGMVAVAMTINPWLVVFVLPPVLVLHRAVLVRHLQIAASTDGKTGLLNAAAWHREAERVLLRSCRASGPMAVLVLDIDHFKSVNDTYGHLAGDQVLAAVAETVRSEVRDGDLVGRFGGEEFVVLLAGRPGGCAVDLEAVADRIRRRVASLQVEIATPDGPLTVIGGVSVSVGAAVHHGGVVELRDLLQIADTALYCAKRSGRNTVRVGSAPPSTVLDATVLGLNTRYATADAPQSYAQ